MNNVKRQGWWKRRQALRAGAATLLGIAIGCAAAIVSAFTPPRDFSFSFLLLLLTTLGPCGGIAGYMFWLAFDPVRERRLRRITRLMAFPAIVGLLVAFPNFWRDMERSLGPVMVGAFLGFIVAMAGLTVVAGLGIVHLVVYLAFSFRPFTKPRADSETDGPWDRELDQS